MTRDDPHFRLRVPAALKKQIEDKAQENLRSMNSEIVARLERSIDGDVVEVATEAETEDLWRQIHQRDARIREIEELSFERHKVLQEISSEYKSLSAQKNHLLNAVCYLVIMNEDVIPDRVNQFARNILESAGEGSMIFSDDEKGHLPEARYHANIRKYLSLTQKAHYAEETALSKPRTGKKSG